MKRLIFPNKALRARTICEYMRRAGIARCVCFSCGNASAALKQEGVETLDISPSGVLMPTLWWWPEDIARVFPTYFDATSGHLPAFLMRRIASKYRGYLGELTDAAYEVPTGSGETILCLRWAYPNTTFVPVTDGTPATERDPSAPLLELALQTPTKGVQE